MPQDTERRRAAMKLLDSAIVSCKKDPMAAALARAYDRILADAERYPAEWDALLSDRETRALEDVDYLKSAEIARCVTKQHMQHDEHLAAFFRDADSPPSYRVMAGSGEQTFEARRQQLLPWRDGRVHVPLSFVQESAGVVERDRVSVCCNGCGHECALCDTTICMGCRDCAYCEKCFGRCTVSRIGHAGCLFMATCGDDCFRLQQAAFDLTQRWVARPNAPLVSASCPNGSEVVVVPVHLEVALQSMGDVPSCLLAGCSIEDGYLCLMHSALVQRMLSAADNVSLRQAWGGGPATCSFRLCDAEKAGREVRQEDGVVTVRCCSEPVRGKRRQARNGKPVRALFHRSGGQPVAGHFRL